MSSADVNFIDTLLYLGSIMWPSFIALLFAGLSNGIMDKLQFHYHNSKLDDWDGDEDSFDPDKTWINKYRDFGNTWIANFYEALRKTALVFTSDLWHLMQWFMIRFVTLAIVLPFYRFDSINKWAITVVYLALTFIPFQVGFTMMFDYILIKKAKQNK